jgi:hypothetical protein
LWNKFCWVCTLFGFENKPEVLQARDWILKLMEKIGSDDADYLDTTGVNYLIRGELKKAEQKFIEVINSLDAIHWSYEFRQRREDWIKKYLKSGKNPFKEKPDLLEKLRQEERES